MYVSALAPFSTSYSYYRLTSTQFSASDLFNRYLQVNFSSPSGVNSQLDALSGLYARAYVVLSLADELNSSAAANGFSQSPAASSDNSVAQATAFATDVNPAGTPSTAFHLNVYQTAQNQLNQGTSLTMAGASVINTGVNNFLFTVGGTGYNLSLTINAGDTNETALNKLAQAINAADTGITADVALSGSAGQINITSPTGTAHAFSLADVSGNAVSASGADNSTRSAQDAEFLLNGTLHTQDGNTVSLLDGQLQVNLTGAGNATVTTNPAPSIDLLRTMVQGMNNLSSFLAGHQEISSGLKSAWGDLVTQTATTYSPYGLGLKSPGQLGLDASQLNTALNQNAAGVAQALTAPGGLGSQVKDFALNLISLPGAALLSVPPSAGPGAMYLRSRNNIPYYRPGSATFWTTA